MSFGFVEVNLVPPAIFACGFKFIEGPWGTGWTGKTEVPGALFFARLLF